MGKKIKIRKESQYLPQSCCVWWGWVGRPYAAGSPGSSPAGCRRTPQSQKRPAGNPTPEWDRRAMEDWIENLYGHICQCISFLLNNKLKSGQSLCQVSPSWRCRGRTFECVRSHGSRGEGSRKGPATTDRYRGPTPVLCSGNTGSGLGWLCTTYGSSPTTKIKSEV